MINATHYIEVFKSKNMVKLIDGPCQPIEKLDISLKITKNSPDLKTLFVWKIRFRAWRSCRFGWLVCRTA